MTAGSHPARSPEFLSRLHDGELSPAERAHFESHRAHCAECRRAAAEFEAALALYRSRRPNPASPDLAARILRKLQSRGNRRPSFGATFGIDLRWAGAFAAAVIATIIGSSIVAKNESAERRMSRDESIRVSIAPKLAVSPPSSPPSRPPPAPAQNGAVAAPRPENRRARGSSPAESRQRQERSGSLAPAPPGSAEKDEAAAADSVREKQKSVDSETASPPSRLAKKNAAPAPASRAAASPQLEAAAPQAAARSAERPGGEGATAQFAEDPARPVRLVIRQADGAGAAPVLLRPGDADVPATLRGRSFLLVIDAAGRVRETVATGRGGREDGATDARKEEVIPSLFSLRFAPGDRPRRLLLRVE